MGIFDTLKNAIFGVQPKVKAGPPASGPSQASPGAALGAGPSAAATPSTTMQGSALASGPTQIGHADVAAPTGQVDVAAILDGMAAKRPEKLDWQSSIVDLMKLVDLDPSLENRKTLAGELGYTGDTRDSARMNVWLHQQVMQKLAASGGKVPDSLRH